MVLNRVRLDEWRSGSLASLCIIAGIGDPLPELNDRPGSPTSQISTATACETGVPLSACINLLYRPLTSRHVVILLYYRRYYVQF